MTMIMQFFVWAGLQFGIPVCDIDPNHYECRSKEQIAGEGPIPAHDSTNRPMQRILKIYNGF